MAPPARSRSHHPPSLPTTFFLGLVTCALFLVYLCILHYPKGDLHWKFEKNIHLLETINHNSVKTSLIQHFLLQQYQGRELGAEILGKAWTREEDQLSEEEEIEISSRGLPQGYFSLLPAKLPQIHSHPYFNLRQRVREAKTPESPGNQLLVENSRRLNFTFKLTSSHCSEDDNLFLAFMSTPNEYKRRQVIRTLWTDAYAKGVRIDGQLIKAKVLFFFGTPKSHLRERESNLSYMQILHDENERFRDIVLIPQFLDSYENLTFKVLASIRYSCIYCPKVTYFAKIDDDTVVNIPEIIRKYLKPCSEDSRCAKQSFVMGHQYKEASVARRGRWIVSKNDYPLDKFPSYMFGGFYLIKGNTCRLWEAAHYFRIINVEDAFVTGILSGSLGFKQITDHKRFAAQFFTNVGSVNPKHFKMGFIYSATDLTLKTLTNFWKAYSEL